VGWIRTRHQTVLLLSPSGPVSRAAATKCQREPDAHATEAEHRDRVERVAGMAAVPEDGQTDREVVADRWSGAWQCRFDGLACTEHGR